MELTDRQIADLRLAALTVQNAKDALKEATTEREQIVRQLAYEGHSYRAISNLAGISYQRVGQITGVDKRIDFMQTMEAWCPKCDAQPGEKCEGASGMFHAERHERRMLILEGELDDVVEGELGYVAV